MKDNINIKVIYYTGSNGDCKESKIVYKSYKSLYNNLNKYHNLKSIYVCDYNKNSRIAIHGYYNIIDFLKSKIND